MEKTIPDKTAKQAREEAEKELDQAQRRWWTVHAVSVPLQEMRRRNNFADLITNALGGGERS